MTDPEKSNRGTGEAKEVGVFTQGLQLINCSPQNCKKNRNNYSYWVSYQFESSKDNATNVVNQSQAE